MDAMAEISMAYRPAARRAARHPDQVAEPDGSSSNRMSEKRS